MNIERQYIKQLNESIESYKRVLREDSIQNEEIVESNSEIQSSAEKISQSSAEAKYGEYYLEKNFMYSPELTKIAEGIGFEEDYHAPEGAYQYYDSKTGIGFAFSVCKNKSKDGNMLFNMSWDGLEGIVGEFFAEAKSLKEGAKIIKQKRDEILNRVNKENKVKDEASEIVVFDILQNEKVIKVEPDTKSGFYVVTLKEEYCNPADVKIYYDEINKALEKAGLSEEVIGITVVDNSDKVLDFVDDEETAICAWCKEEFPIYDMKKEVNLGYLCDSCQRAIESRGEELVFESEAPKGGMDDSSSPDYVIFDEEHKKYLCSNLIKMDQFTDNIAEGLIFNRKEDADSFLEQVKKCKVKEI